MTVDENVALFLGLLMDENLALFLGLAFLVGLLDSFQRLACFRYLIHSNVLLFMVPSLISVLPALSVTLCFVN